MKKNVWFVFLVFVAGTLLAGRASVAQQSSDPVFQTEDNDSKVCQRQPVDLSELAGKVKAHSFRLRDLECVSQDLSNRARLLANQAGKATAEQKAEAEEMEKQAKAAESRIKRLRAKVKEIEEIKGDSTFASNLRKFLVEEAKKDANDAAKAIAALSTKMDGLALRLSLVEGKVAAGEKILQEHALAINQTLNDVAELKEKTANLGVTLLGLASRGGVSSTLGLRLGIPLRSSEFGVSASAGISSRGKVLAWDVGVDKTYEVWLIFTGPTMFVSSTHTERDVVRNLMIGVLGWRVGWTITGPLEFVVRAGIGPYLTTADEGMLFGWSAGGNLGYRF